MASDQLNRLLRRLEAIPKAVKAAVQPALVKSGDELVDRMRHLAPKDSHDLEQSIVATPAGQSTPAYSQPGGSKVVPENAILITVGDTRVRYPHLVEFGTAHAHAQPYFWPAYRLTRKRIATRIKRAIGKAVRDGWVAK
jgi:HK97 gp10 family phage protein